MCGGTLCPHAGCLVTSPHWAPQMHYSVVWAKEKLPEHDGRRTTENEGEYEVLVLAAEISDEVIYENN